MRDKINDPARLELMLEAIANIGKYLDGYPARPAAAQAVLAINPFRKF